MRFTINEQTGIRVAGYPASGPDQPPGAKFESPVVALEIGASCGALGTYGIHLSPDQARALADLLTAEAVKAEGL